MFKYCSCGLRLQGNGWKSMLQLYSSCLNEILKSDSFTNTIKPHDCWTATHNGACRVMDKFYISMNLSCFKRQTETLKSNTVCIPSPQITLNVTVPPDKSKCFQIKWSKQIFNAHLLSWKLDWGDPDGLNMTSSKHHTILHANSFFMCRTWLNHELLSRAAYKLLLINGGCWHPFRISFYSPVFKGFDVIALPQIMWNRTLRKYPTVSAISLRLAC